MNKIEIIQALAVEREENDITELQMAKQMVITPSLVKKYHDEVLKIERTGESSIITTNDYQMAMVKLLSAKNKRLTDEQIELITAKPMGKVVCMYSNSLDRRG